MSPESGHHRRRCRLRLELGNGRAHFGRRLGIALSSARGLRNLRRSLDGEDQERRADEVVVCALEGDEPIPGDRERGIGIPVD